MFKLLLSFIQNEGYHHARYESQGHREHQYVVETLGCILSLLVGVEDRVRRRGHIEFKVIIIELSLEDGLIEVLGEDARHILTCDVEERVELPVMVVQVGFKDLE